MKKLLILSTILLTSCGWMIPPPFDSNEYGLYVELETHSRFLKDECANPDDVRNRLTKMLFVAEQLSTYTYHLPDNDELYDATQIIAGNVNEMAEKYEDGNEPSAVYCKLKAKIITGDTNDVLDSLGALK